MGLTTKTKVDVVLGLPTHDGTWVWETTHCIERMAQYCAGKVSMVALRRQREPVAEARSGMVNDALELGAKWILFIDSDMTFPEDALERLMSHDVDIVSGMAVKCSPPFTICSSVTENEWEHFYPVGTSDCPTPLPEDGLMEISGCGGAFMLVKTEVLKKMEKPHFSQWFNKRGYAIGEDFNFCRKATLEAGAKVYLDTDLDIGHVHPAIYWPKHFFQHRAAEARAKMNAEIEKHADDQILNQLAEQNKMSIDQKMDKAIIN